jgi:hypothetical protein
LNKYVSNVLIAWKFRYYHAKQLLCQRTNIQEKQEFFQKITLLQSKKTIKDLHFKISVFVLFYTGKQIKGGLVNFSLNTIESKA